MPQQREYFKFLLENPASTLADVVGRFKTTKPSAVEQMFRRGKSAGFIQGDGGSPCKFSLTDLGRRKLSELENAGLPAVSASPFLSPLSPVQTEAIVKGLADELAKRLGGDGPTDEVSQDLESEMLEELQEQIGELQQENARLDEENKRLADSAPPVELFELYGLHLALSDLPRRIIRERSESLTIRLSAEDVTSVERLVQLETELENQKGRIWGGDEQRIAEIQNEINSLRETLGFPVEEFTHEDSGESEPAAAEGSDAQRPKKHGKWL